MNRKSLKKAIPLVLTVAAVFVAVIVVRVPTRTVREKPPVEPSENRLEWFANEAKKAGKRAVVVPPELHEYPEINSTDDVLKYSTILVAKY